MTRPRRAAGTGVALLAAALLAGSAPAAEVDPFYQRLLESGVRAFEGGDHARAAEDLRIAAFGLLETPAELARALAHLALAQHATGDREGFTHSCGRLAELEERFRAYSAAALGAEARSALELAARTRLGIALRAEADPPAAPEPAPVASAPAEPARPVAAAPSRPRVCVSWTGDGECRPAATAAAPDAPAPSGEELAALDRLDRLAAGKATSKKLRAGFARARELADRYPRRADMQRVAGVLAARSGAFADAVRYYERAGDQIEDRPLQLFYLSVALFETDRLDAAATVLRRALPALEQNREVRRYMRRILSEESAG